jgi:hypothetical protein
MNPGHKFGTPFQEGPLFAKSADMGAFAEYPGNSELLRKLNKRVKIFRGKDGWFAKGKRSQLWEYGIRKLGFTIDGGLAINNSINAGFVPTQLGDGEANFATGWNEESVERLIKLLHLRVRGAGNPSPKPIPERVYSKISGFSERADHPPPTGVSGGREGAMITNGEGPPGLKSEGQAAKPGQRESVDFPADGRHLHQRLTVVQQSRAGRVDIYPGTSGREVIYAAEP